ncbi:DUF1565 domain-containing protein, partial [candidate division KSB1 bacterium]|nr:DUF1565 domain-containing protein [candidate division KSB1 bacterium]
MLKFLSLKPGLLSLGLILIGLIPIYSQHNRSPLANRTRSLPQNPSAANSATGSASASHFQMRINVGGEQYLDLNGQTWLADHIYQSGSYGYLGISNTYTTTESIQGTSDAPLYQNQRFGLWGYRIDLPNGHYEITLHFAEIVHKRAGKRVLSVKLEGQSVAENLDLLAQTEVNAAFTLKLNTKTLGVPILDRRLDLEIINKRDVTYLAAIEVVQLMESVALLKINPLQLQFNVNDREQTLEIANLGNQSIQCNLTVLQRTSQIQVPAMGVTRISAGETVRLPIRINRSGLSSGVVQDTLKISAAGFEQKISITLAVSGPARLQAEPTPLDFSTGRRQQTLILRNTGGSPLRWEVNAGTLPAWINRLYPPSGALEMGAEIYVNVVVTRQALAPGAHQTTLNIASNAGATNVVVQITVPRPTSRPIFVKATENGVADGRTWESAFGNIQAALASVGAASLQIRPEIWVAEGIYYEYGLQVPTGVTLYGGFIGDETGREERPDVWNHPSIIDGQRRGRVLELAHRTVVDGFVIQNGRDWEGGEGKGAAILSYEADVQIRNNLIQHNVDSWAGAVFVEGFDLSKKAPGFSPLIERNVFRKNFSNYCAAAIEIRGSQATVRNNTILNNWGFGLEIQDLLGPHRQVIYGNFYNNIITNNKRHAVDDVWAEARKVTNFCFVGKRWNRDVGAFPPYDYGRGNLFGDELGVKVGFIDEEKGDYRLRHDSPAIDAGDPKSGADPDGSRLDLGAFPFFRDRLEVVVQPTQLTLNSTTPTQTLTIRGYGGKTLPWQTTLYSPDGVALIVNPTAGTLTNGEPVTLKITLEKNTIPDGIYPVYLAILTPEASQEIPISVTVNRSRPEMQLEPAKIELESRVGGTLPKVPRVKIMNVGQGELRWAAMKKGAADWLNFYPTSGRGGEFLEL